MIPQSIINEVIERTNIVDIISENITLTKKGVNFVAKCPFHEEKTGSFVVSEAKQIYKCYGCGKGGNVVSFVMYYNNLTFIEAIKDLAKKAGVEIKEEKQTPEEIKLNDEKKQLYVIFQEVTDFYKENLYKKENKSVLQYAKGRFLEPTLKLESIGYSLKAWDSLYLHLKNKGFSEAILNKTGLFRESKNKKVYDFFRDRLMFPIRDRMGRVISFSGRAMDPKEEAKYINGSETLIYVKSNVLYGLHVAINAIRKYDVAVLVEGNPDVVKLHQLNINNVVAGCGTSLSKEQILTLKNYTSNICLLYDNDDAGEKAIHRSAKLILEHKMNCLVLSLPYTIGVKNDPDSFFKSNSQFSEYYTNKAIPYPLYLATQKADKCEKNPTYAANTAKEILQMIMYKDISEREALMDSLSKIIKPRKIWSEALKELEQGDKKKAKELTVNGRTHEQNKMIERYGFYINKNSYYFMSQKNGEMFFQGSNFVMEPLFHIKSSINAKRLYRLTNEFNVKCDIEFPQKDLIALSAFKLKCESIGNFRFDAGDYGLSKIKAYLYEQTKTCEEIIQMGWQDKGFWAWSNGIVENGTFKPIDAEGICVYNNENFYIPANSSFYKHDMMLFQFERKFRNKESNILPYKLITMWLNVFGENAVVGWSYYLASLFRDIVIIYNAGKYPILNIFGPKGTGKSEMAKSMLKMFGDLPVGINMTNSTKAALSDHVSQTKNAVCHIDEYKNSIEFEKIEFLKGLYDGTGRSRMNMDKDKKKEMTNVDTGIILTGQEMTTADNALFSRILFLSFTKYEFSDLDKERYKELKMAEEMGLTHITNKMLSLRKYFFENFKENYDQVCKDMTVIIEQSTIEDRIFINWCLILGVLKTFIQVIEMPITYQSSLRIFANFMLRQNKETSANNEISTFWEIFSFMVREGIIENEYDFCIRNECKLKTDKVDMVKSVIVIYIDKTRIFQHYSKHGKITNQKILPIPTLKYYLENSKDYFGTKKGWRFKKRTQNLQNISVVNKLENEIEKVETFITSAYCFNYAGIGLEIETSFENKTDVNANQ